VNLDRFQSLNTEVITQLVVIVVGLGRAGMALFKELLQWPIKGIIAFDDDTVSAREVGSVFPVGTEGMAKVDAAGHLLNFMRGDEVAYVALKMPIELDTFPMLAKAVRHAHILFWAADDWSILPYVPDCVPEIPQVGIAFGEGGAYAEVASYIPGQTVCLTSSMRPQFKESEPNARSVPTDVNFAANIAVQCGMAILLAGHKGYSQFGDLLDPKHPLLIVHGRNNDSLESPPRISKMVYKVRMDQCVCGHATCENLL